MAINELDRARPFNLSAFDLAQGRAAVGENAFQGLWNIVHNKRDVPESRPVRLRSPRVDPRVVRENLQGDSLGAGQSKVLPANRCVDTRRARNPVRFQISLHASSLATKSLNVELNERSPVSGNDIHVSKPHCLSMSLAQFGIHLL